MRMPIGIYIVWSTRMVRFTGDLLAGRVNRLRGIRTCCDRTIFSREFENISGLCR